MWTFFSVVQWLLRTHMGIKFLIGYAIKNIKEKEKEKENEKEKNISK